MNVPSDLLIKIVRERTDNESEAIEVARIINGVMDTLANITKSDKLRSIAINCIVTTYIEINRIAESEKTGKIDIKDKN